MYRILLADDEGIMLESLKKIIETEYGNECESTVQSQAELWWRWHRHIAGYLFLWDIQMPGISGIQAIREIQKFNSSAVL